MKILVLGAKGMLGREVMHSLEEYGYEALPLGYPNPMNSYYVGSPSFYVEKVRIETVEARHLENCDILINCAGIVKQKNVTPYHLMLVNALGPHRLEEVARHTGTQIIHISTDCVFSAPGPHYEGDVVSPADMYGLSKAAGELDNPHLTLRTSFIGWAEHGLLWDIMHYGALHASHNLLWNGHTARTVAHAIAELVPLHLAGIMHLPGEEQTRHQLVSRISQVMKRNVTAIDNDFTADRRLASHRYLPIYLPPFEDQLLELAKGPLE